MEFARQLWGEDAYRHLYSSVFYGKCGKMHKDSTHLTELLRKYSLEHLDVKIGIQQYRQIAAAVARRFGILHLMDDPDDLTDGFHGQMGHSHHVADLFYGLEPGDEAADNARTRAVYEEASRVWHHKFLGLRRTAHLRDEVEPQSELEQLRAKVEGLDAKLTIISQQMGEIMLLLKGESGTTG